MTHDFTSRLPLSRHRIDRDHLSRSKPLLFDELWADVSTRVLVLHDGSALLAERTDTLQLLRPSEVPDAELLIYLGRSLDDGVPYVAAILAEAPSASLGGGARWGHLRTLGASLSDLEAGLFTEALAMAHWHRSHEFSPRSGHRTSSALGGWVRRADDDGHDLFPRTDAAIIVGVTDGDDRILLGSNAMWESNRYSLLAGFVEPGESLEGAVIREVFEEAGIRVTDPHYLGSQPWPFPASLMLGFRAKVDPDFAVLKPDGAEIVDVRWFSRDELAASLHEIALPGGTSIARAIIEDWYGGPLVDLREW